MLYPIELRVLYLWSLRANLNPTLTFIYPVCIPVYWKVMTGVQKEWESTPVQNLVRYAPSGTYYARFKVGGKLFRRSLHTPVLSVAKLRLADALKDARGANEQAKSITSGKVEFIDAVNIYRERIRSDGSLKPKSKVYRELTISCILKTWPGIRHADIRKISNRECVQWFGRFQHKYAPSVVNNTISTLRAIFAEAIAAGTRFSNPASDLKRVRLRSKKMTLPSRQQFLQFVGAIELAGSRDSKSCATLVRFLAYSGLRIGESKHVTWHDLDFEKQKVHVRGDPQTATKNGEMRVVPMIPELQSMLEKMRHERAYEPKDTPIMRVHECQKSMDRAAKIVGMERITHHDLRHLFATICIESGVDIPTVSRWLGHKDGGALAMKVYGHLRDEHSAAQAQRVKFGVTLNEDGQI